MTRYSKPEYLTDFSNDTTIWTRRFGDEYWADAYTPLSYCLLRHWISNISLPPSKKVHNKFRYHKGFAYISSEYWLDVMSEAPPSSRLPSVRAYLCKKDQAQFDELPLRVWKSLVSLLKLTPLYRTSKTDGITRNHIAMKEWQAATHEAFQELMDTDLSTRSVDDLLGLFTTWKEKGDYHFLLLRAGQAAWGPLMTQALTGHLEKWISEEAALKVNVLMSGLPGSITLETNKDLYQLAEAAADPTLRGFILDENRASEAIDYVRAHPGDDFSKLFNRFVSKYRHRGAAREMIADRWEDRPEMIIDLMRGFVGAEALHDPVSEEKEKRAAREQFQTEIMEALQQSGGAFLRTRIHRWVLRMAQAYYLYRENQRFTLDQIFYALKRISLEIGRKYTQKGLLDHHEHIFYLFEDELFDLASEPDYRDEIRQDAVCRSKDYPSQVGNFPPTFLQGLREFEEAEEDKPAAGENGSGGDDVTVLEGLAVSAGNVTGRARVITRIEEIGRIQKGEILVSSNTDPAWTPVFINLAGLVMETGGVLCHGAIVSREYGIPAVTFISRATQIIKTGQQVEVDGDAGIIRILNTQ